MSVFGKCIGGALGWAIGGPLGGIIGVAIGHEFDRKKKPIQKIESDSGMNNGSSPQRQMTFFVAVFSMLGKMANADGKITEDESRAVENFIENELKLSKPDHDFAMRIFYAAASSAEEFDKFASQFYECFRHDFQMIEMMMDILVRLAYADNVLSSAEEQFIARAAMCFSYPAANVAALKTKYRQSASQQGYTGQQSYQDSSYHDNHAAGNSSESLEVAYSILGCNIGDPDDVIKSKYKKLVKEYHPDVIASKGLPEEFAEFANNKFRQIQSAYETVKKARGL
ncbi:MAG: co-chaperone DjlA [Spirochaetia bacterium]|nr:co-chaperone DjlA [Spirochaetia bacterium]